MKGIVPDHESDPGPPLKLERSDPAMAGIGRLRKFDVVLENGDPTTPAPIPIVQVGLSVTNRAKIPALVELCGRLHCHRERFVGG